MPKETHQEHIKPSIINRDGSLNIHRPRRERDKLFSDLYHYFLSISWPKFFFILIGIFFAFNVLFGFLYFWAGPDSLEGIHQSTELERLLNCFFYSVKSLDKASPVGVWPNILATIETYMGILTLVIVTGLLYARFARPHARVIFSNHAAIHSYNNKPCLVFRVANERLNQIAEAHMSLTLTRNETSKEGETSRRLHHLKLENDYSPLFALSWTLRHFLDHDSPLLGMDENKLKDTQVAIIASLTGTDETFNQPITARTVYRYDEIVFNKRFKDMLVWDKGKVHINLKGIHEMHEINSEASNPKR